MNTRNSATQMESCTTAWVVQDPRLVFPLPWTWPAPSCVSRGSELFAREVINLLLHLAVTYNRYYTYKSRPLALARDAVHTPANIALSCRIALSHENKINPLLPQGVTDT